MSLPLDYFLRTTLVFGLAFLVTRILQRQPSAFRHVIWICAFCIAALTPVLSHFGPSFHFESEAPPTIAPKAAAVVSSPIALVFPPAPPASKKIPYFEILWIAGILPFVVRTWNAARNARALLKNAIILNLPQAPSSRIAESDAIATPMTLGVFRPWILLPAEHKLWDGDRLRAVLLHELAHVRRRDCLVQWLPNIVCAVNWFNPLAWFARAEMLCEGERACDDAVIRSGISGNAFAQDLVDIARSIQLKGNSLMSTALTTKLERRIQRLIDPSTDRAVLSLGRTVFGAVLALVLLAPVAGVRADQVVRVPAVSAAPEVATEPALAPEPVPAPARAPGKAAPAVPQAAQPAPLTQPTPLTPTTPLTPLTTLAQATPAPQPAPSSQPSSAGSISGVVTDPTGAVVPNAVVQVHGGSTNVFTYRRGPVNGSVGEGVFVYRTVTGPLGEWSFDGLPVRTYTIDIQSPGFAAFSNALTVNPGLNDRIVSHLSLGRISESLTITAQASNTSAVQPRAQSSSQPIRVGGNVQAAKLIHRVDPVFPQSARDRGVQGPVTIQAIIGKNGFIKDTFQTVSDAPADLAQAAIDAIRLWQFEPTRLNGEPVEIMTEITVNFQLQ